MTVSLILHDGIVQIPTSYTIQRGFYFEHVPLVSVPVGQTSQLREAILTAVKRGNPPISRDEVSRLSKSKDIPMLAATGARSWYAVELQIKESWSIKEKDGAYRIQVDRPMKPRGWHEDPEKTVLFPPGTPVDEVIARAIAMMQERARE